MNATRQPGISLLGDSAILVDWGGEIDPRVNARVHALGRSLMEAALPGVEECVPGYASLLVVFDPLRTDRRNLEKRIKEWVSIQGESDRGEGRLVKIPVRYGGEFGPDLEFVAKHCRLSESEVIRLHSAAEYMVFFIGFLPGFPYLGGMDTRLATPRLAKPRKVVPAGSVGIAGNQTGIYPLASPGGWQLIGRTDLALFAADRAEPALLSPGDRVRFVPSGRGV